MYEREKLKKITFEMKCQKCGKKTNWLDAKRQFPYLCSDCNDKFNDMVDDWLKKED